MTCAECGAESPSGKRFCGDCGAPLGLRCSACGAEVVAGKRYCGDCGAAVAGSRLTNPTLAQRERLDTETTQFPLERRHLTVLFADLVSSTALSSRLDPEDFREILAAYQRCVATIVKRHGGFIAQYLGDGVLAYFGYPTAHEDDAERAVLAALDSVREVSTLRLEQLLEPLQARMGIATGSVVVGELAGSDAGRELGALGDTPNLAARLQSVAEPGSVVIAATTERLTRGLFELRAVDSLTLKGFAQRVPAFQVLRPSAIPSRFEALHGSILTPLVGRDEELGVLRRRWEQACSGRGRVHLLSGEPGVGKSRLVVDLLRALDGSPHGRLRYFCSQHHSASALYPFITQVEYAAGLRADDDADAKLRKLETLMGRGLALRQDLALLAELLSIDHRGRYVVQTMSPREKKESLLSGFVRHTTALASSSALVIALEDAHWIDPTSLELLDRLVARLADLPILLIVTHRPEFQSSWIGQPHVSVQTLSRLSRGDAREIIMRVSGGGALPDEVIATILDRSDGVPLFVEELTSAILESGLLFLEGDRYVLRGPLPPVAVPATLQASLVARLDRLPSAKDVAQIGAAIGRQFAYEVLAAVAATDDSALRDALEKLTNSGLLLQRGEPPAATYEFKHALVQDAAYGTLPRSRRHQLHAAIARALVSQSPDMAHTEPETLARHYTEGGMLSDAVGYWLKAGQLAASRSASAEALSHLRRGLDLVASLQDGIDRRHLELEFRCAIGPAYAAVKGYAAPEVTEAFERARELLHDVDGGDNETLILTGLYVAYYNRTEHRRGLEFAKEFLERAQRSGDPANLCIANRCVAATNNVFGDFRTACQHAERAWSYYDPTKHGREAWRYVHDIGVAAKSHWALALWHLGETQRSAELCIETLGLAEQIYHQNTLGYALFYAGSIPAFCGQDYANLREHANRLQCLGRDDRMPQWEAWGACMQAPGLAAAGDFVSACEHFERGMAIRAEIGNHCLTPLFLAALAQAQILACRHTDALETIGSALGISRQTEEQWLDAELWRLRAEALVATGAADAEADRCYSEAVAIARTQGSMTFELRAVKARAALDARRL